MDEPNIVMLLCIVVFGFCSFNQNGVTIDGAAFGEKFQCIFQILSFLFNMNV